MILMFNFWLYIKNLNEFFNRILTFRRELFNFKKNIFAIMMKKVFLWIFFVVLGIQFLGAQETYNTLIYEGNKEFSRKNYEGSSSKFMQAVKKNEKDFTAHYNLGNALYKKQMYEEAKAEYEKAQSLAKNKNDKMAALYNLGNVYMQTNNHEKAANYYKQALKWDPYNETARKNYEIAMLKEKEQQQKQNNGKGGGGSGKDGKNQQQQSDENGKNQQQSGGQGNQQQNGKGNDGNEPDQNKKENNGSKMPKDVENSILSRVEGKEKETARKILNKNSYSMPRSNEKDW